MSAPARCSSHVFVSSARARCELHEGHQPERQHEATMRARSIDFAPERRHGSLVRDVLVRLVWSDQDGVAA